jgi:cell division protein ZapA (FtsZ GTPase activity inhibitor)
MRQVKASSRLQGADRIAVMAALTLARDVLGGGALQDSGVREEALKKITAISQTLDAALVPQEKLF